MYIDEITYKHIGVWETIRKKNDAKFVKDLAVQIWGTPVLQSKCLNLSRANKNAQDKEDEIRKILTPRKYQLIKGKFSKNAP